MLRGRNWGRMLTIHLPSALVHVCFGLSQKWDLWYEAPQECKGIRGITDLGWDVKYKLKEGQSPDCLHASFRAENSIGVREWLGPSGWSWVQKEKWCVCGYLSGLENVFWARSHTKFWVLTQALLQWRYRFWGFSSDSLICEIPWEKFSGSLQGRTQN